jgi:hypothetical protein
MIVNPNLEVKRYEKNVRDYPIGQETVRLGCDYENSALGKISDIQNDIENISNDLFLILDLLKELRKAKEEGGDKVNISHLENKIRQFQDIWDTYAKRYQIFREDEDPFMGKNLNAVPKKELEWIEMTMKNLESKNQGQIQTEMTHLEIAMTAQKMIFEIFVQIAKSLRESQGYWIKKQNN